MHPSTTVLALGHRARKTGQALLILGMLTLLLLIAAAAGFFHPSSSQAGVQFAATNGEIHVGGPQQAHSSQAGIQLAASVGDIHVGSGG